MIKVTGVITPLVIDLKTCTRKDVDYREVGYIYTKGGRTLIWTNKSIMKAIKQFMKLPHGKKVQVRSVDPRRMRSTRERYEVYWVDKGGSKRIIAFFEDH